MTRYAKEDLDQFRSELEAWWTETQAQEMARKDSQAVLSRLIDLYGGFAPHVRLLADEVLAEWLVSTDVARRFDALALVHKFRIRTALEQLRVLESRLATQEGPEARYELKKVKRTIADLGE